MTEENQNITSTEDQDASHETAAGSEAPEGTKSAQETFDLFDEPSAMKKKTQQKRAQANAQAQKGNGAGQKQAPEQRKKFESGKELHYSGHKLTLPSEMTEAEIFSWLEDDFPELTTDRAEVRKDSAKGRLVISLKSFKKGAIGCTGDCSRDSDEAAAGDPPGGKALSVLTKPPPESVTPPLYRLLAHDGVYDVRTTGAGTFIARTNSSRCVDEGYYPVLPKAPYSLLARTVEIFKQMPEREAVVNVVYDRDDETFHLIWADQRDATSGGITYDPVPETDRFVPYVEIHSHNTMPAFFSQTDDAHEVRTGCYGVVGYVDRELPTLLFRFSCGGSFRPLGADDLFAATSEEEPAPHTIALGIRHFHQKMKADNEEIHKP